MNRFRLSLRRTLSVAAAAALGLVGVLFVASPASAHHSVLDGVGSCDYATGKWVINWTVNEYHPTGRGAPTTMKFFSVSETFKDTSWHTVADGDLPYTNTPKNNSTYPYTLPGPYNKTQSFDATTTEVILKLKGKWSNGFYERDFRYKHVKFYGSCEQNKPSPSASSESNCDGSVDVTLANNGGKADAKFTIDGLPAGTVTVAPNATPVVVHVPAGFGPITVNEAGIPLAGGPISWSQPEGCSPVEITSRKDCTSLTIELSNPDGPTHHYVVKSGDKTQSGDLAPGATKVLDPFPATAGTTATVAIDNDEPETVVWETQDVCYTPPATDPSLPVTGTSGITPLVSVGGALLVAGIGSIALLFMLRRRRTTAGS